MKNKLKSYRALMGMDQKKMAEAIGIATTTYCKKERGDRNFTQKEMVKLVQIIQEHDSTATMDGIFMP